MQDMKINKLGEATSFIPTDSQQQVVESIRDKNTMIQSTRQAGLSTILYMYALCRAISKPDVKVCITTHNASSCVLIYKMIIALYKTLPNSKVINKVNYNPQKNQIKIDDSVIDIISRQLPYSRGLRYDVIIQDNCNHITEEWVQYTHINIKPLGRIIFALTHEGIIPKVWEKLWDSNSTFNKITLTGMLNG